MCRTNGVNHLIREIEVNVAYRWFLGLGFNDEIPYFRTFSQNYRRRFAGIELLFHACDKGLVDSKIQFIDSTHVKAHANRHKNEKVSNNTNKRYRIKAKYALKNKIYWTFFRKHTIEIYN